MTVERLDELWHKGEGYGRAWELRPQNDVVIVDGIRMERIEARRLWRERKTTNGDAADSRATG